MVDASEIEVDVRNGEVFLKGTVNSRQEKRRAEDVVENISGVKNVENHIKVQQAGFKSGIVADLVSMTRRDLKRIPVRN